MQAIETRFTAMKTAAEKEEMTSAQEHAALIQAEAKARARVAGEAAMIQDRKMARASAAWDLAKREVAELKEAYTVSIQTHATAVTKLQGLVKTLAYRREALASAKAQAEAALKRWKLLAQQRAAAEAVRIQAEASQRARTELAAAHIQGMAVAKAKAEADAAHKSALATQSTTFSVSDELVVRIGDMVRRFETVEARDAWLAENRLNAVGLKVKEEDLIGMEASWRIQRSIVLQLIRRAETLQEEYRTTCAAAKTATFNLTGFQTGLNSANRDVAVAEKVELAARYNTEALEKEASRVALEGAEETVVVEAETKAAAAAAEYAQAKKRLADMKARATEANTAFVNG